MARDGLPRLRAARPGRWDVVCLGLNASDLICQVPRFPRQGGKLRMSAMEAAGGGQSATAACALARLGHRVAYAGAAGDDEPGHLAGQRLEAFGVHPVGLVIKPGATSQQAFILVEENSGERTIIWTRDKACRLEPEDLDPDLISNCRVLHLDGHFIEASLEAARIARQAGAIITMDGERIQPGTRDLVGLCHVVVGEESFAQRLTGIDEPLEALRAMAQMGPAWAGRTLGADGAEMLVQGRLLTQPAYKVQAVDTTGAGDVFHAGMAHAILDGQDAQQALATSCALAAISVTGLGGRSMLPDLAGLRDFMARQAT